MLEKWIISSLGVNIGLLMIDFLLVKLYRTFEIEVIPLTRASWSVTFFTLFWFCLSAPPEIDVIIFAISFMTWFILRLLFCKQLNPKLNEKKPPLNK